MTRRYEIEVLDAGEWRYHSTVEGYFAEATQAALEAGPYLGVRVHSPHMLVYEYRETPGRETIPSPDPSDWAAPEAGE